MRRRPTRRAGYTLLELMIVVVIVGILAAIAIPSFSSYVQRSRTLEAFTFLADIRSRQTAYRLERGRYCGDLPWNPGSYAAPGTVVGFNTADVGWAQLGAAPDGPTRFRYRVLAGNPGTASGIPGLTGDFWYVAQAEADLDGDGRTMVVEAYSAQRQVYVSQGVGGAFLPSGWE